MISKEKVSKSNFALSEFLEIFWGKPQRIHIKFCALEKKNLKRKNWKKICEIGKKFRIVFNLAFSMNLIDILVYYIGESTNMYVRVEIGHQTGQ